MKQEDEYEFDDVDIVNGKLIFKSEKKQEKETLPKVEEIVSKWEEISKKEIGADINKKIIREMRIKLKIVDLQLQRMKLKVLLSLRKFQNRVQKSQKKVELKILKDFTQLYNQQVEVS